MSQSDLQAAADLVADAHRMATVPDDEEGMRALLYHWYLNIRPLSARTGPPRPVDLNLVGALAAAHAGRVRFTGGWKARQVSSWGRVVAVRNDQSRVAHRHEYRVPGRPGRAARPDDALLMTEAWTWVDQTTGYWMARAGSWPPAGADRLIRLYWNVAPRDAPDLVAQLTGILRDAGTESFMMKTPAAAEHGGRADAFVAYLAPAGYADVRERLEDLPAMLREASPRFTKQLRPGLGYAEGHLDGASFGDAICAILAKSWWTRREEMATSDSARILAILISDVRRSGRDPDHLYRLPARP